MLDKSLLIRSCKIISSKNTIIGDVFIKNGIIEKIGTNLKVNAIDTIYAKNQILIPGVIDPHVHMREPGMEWKEDFLFGSIACASGGVTTFFDMPNTKPPSIDSKSINLKKLHASQKSLVNYNCFIGATNTNLTELNETPNIPGIKIFMGSSTGDLLVSDDSILDNIFAKSNKLIAVHAEDEKIIKNNMLDFANDTSKLKHLKIRSVDAAMSAIKKATDLSIKYKKRLHICHVTSEEEVKYLKNIKNYKFISSEVTPQHLFLFGPEAYDNLENCAIVNPPIRYRSDADALWTALKEGIIDCIASDHAPHLLEEKQKNSPSGVPGVETMLPLMLNQASMGRCTINEIVKWMCENPANIFHIKNKGYIKEGFDADLVLIDPSKTKLIENGKLHTKCNWSPFHGTYIKGIPIMTIVNGNIIFQNNEFSMENQGKEVNFF